MAHDDLNDAMQHLKFCVPSNTFILPPSFFIFKKLIENKVRIQTIHSRSKALG